jgi:hypothetical protein
MNLESFIVPELETLTNSKAQEWSRKAQTKLYLHKSYKELQEANLENMGA